MEKLKNRKILVIGIIILIIIIIVITILLLPKASNEVASAPHVKHSVVDKLYKDIETNKEEDTKKYVSKLYGYSYDENENLEVQVKEGYIENNKIYDLTGKELGEYTEDSLNNVLDNGTLKTYNYTKSNDEYKLQE